MGPLQCMVISWIISNVSKGLLSRILFKSTACSVWKDLREQFNKVNLSQVYHLHKEIAPLVRGTSPVLVYYSRLKELWMSMTRLCPHRHVTVTNPRSIVNIFRSSGYSNF